jgi:putative hydrolase of the HAD superfamily
MPAAAPPTLVCFDLGGVVVQLCRSWAEACALLGLPAYDTERWSAPPIWQRRQQLVQGYQRGQISCDAYYAGLYELLGDVYSREQIERVHAGWLGSEYPGVRELIAELNTLDAVTTACLSNTNHGHWQRLLGADGNTLYPSVASLQLRLASHELGCLKPGADIYLRAQAIFARPAEQIVFFDDLAENVAAATALGWRGYQIDHTGDTARQMRRTLAELGLLRAD